MKESEKTYISNLISHTESSIKFFSNAMKPERERSVCVAFLKCLGIDYSVNDIIAQEDDPPDVIFGPARFEIRELYEEGRRRQDEYRDRLDELKQANSMDDTLIPVKSPTPISYKRIFSGINSALSLKAQRYGENLCSSLDALIYVSLPQEFLDRDSELSKFDKIMVKVGALSRLSFHLTVMLYFARILPQVFYLNFQERRE